MSARSPRDTTASAAPRRLWGCAIFVAAVFLAITVFTFDPDAWDETASSGNSPSVILGVVAWLVATLAGGWLLGRNAGAAYGVLISVAWIGVGVVRGEAHADVFVWMVIVAIAGAAFGGVTGAFYEQFHLARARNAELASKNAELLRTSDALARSEAMFRQFTDRVELGVFIRPVAPGSTAFSNPRAREILGLERADEDWLKNIHPNDRKLAAEANEMLQRGTPVDIEFRVKLPGREARWVRSQAFTVADSQGALTTLAGVLEDITERKDKEAQRELLERRERLSALGTLVAGVAHEINNPLTYVMGNMELARMEYAAIAKAHAIAPERSARIDRLLTTSFEGSERIAKIVRALRAVTRSGTNGHIEDVNLNVIASNVHALMRTSVPTTLELELRLSDVDPVVRGNSGELHQILLNLATNAVQAMGTKQGKIVIETLVEARNSSIVVRDEGPGLTEETRARLFTPFFTTKSEGTGLGLSIAHAIVREHDGDIEVESRPGEGATFRVRLPRAMVPPMREVAA